MKYLRIFLIAIALALASIGVWAQKPTEPKDLAEGFISRSIVFEDGSEIIQIVFPAKYRVFEDNVLLFDEGAEHALKAHFGCAKFKDCKPKLNFDHGPLVEVGIDTYRLSLLQFDPSNPYSKVVGINAVKVPKVIL